MSDAAAEPVHLWEVEHPYYCNETNFYSVDAGPHDHGSWEAFAEAMGSSDPELNLLFRWDWKSPTDAEDWETPAHPEDASERAYELLLFFVLQRKGIFTCHRVAVSRTDEAAVRTWLTGRMGHLVRLWAPLGPATSTDAT